MSCWLTDPDLFLYAKGIGSDDVHLWRCKKPVSCSSSSSDSSLVMPMKPDDFDYVSNVENHMELNAYMFDWDETDYKRLVKYIFERRLLVNMQGFVIAELMHKAVDQQDGNKMIDDANEEVPIYIRSLDVLSLEPYIPMLREGPIPLRTVKYLGDVSGKAAVMMEDSKVTNLTARVADLEDKVTKLTSELNRMKNKEVWMNDVNGKAAVMMEDSKVTNLTARVEDLEDKVTKLTSELDRIKNKEVWMNDLTHTEWVGLDLLTAYVRDTITIIRQKGTFTTDDNSTNVQASYCYAVKIDDFGIEFKAVCLEDLTPNKEKARFSPNWVCNISQGKTYICL